MSDNDDFVEIKEGLWKKVIQRGDGEPIHPQAHVTVHYTGTLESDGSQFDSSRGEGRDAFEFQLGRGQVIGGWDHGVASMSKGERATLKCSPEMGYGEHGSPPSIPGSATLLFDVEVLSWREPERSRSEMSTDELVAGALEDKKRGNEAFKAGNFLGALERYDDAQNWLKHVYQEREKAQPVTLSLHLNAAACHLKLDQWRKAVDSAQSAISADPNSAKAYWRRAQARELLGELPEAKADLVKAVKLDPGNRTFRNDHAKVVEKMKQAASTEKSMFKSMFQSGAPSLYDDKADLIVWKGGPLPKVFMEIEIGADESSGEGVELGRLEFTLFADKAPKTAENFRALCCGDQGLGQLSKKPLAFEKCQFHRIISGFMMQGGDFTAGDGTGGESIYGGKFDDEQGGLALEHDRPFLLSMANAGKNTNGSQFFITFAATPHLNGKHAVFGELTSGSEFVRKVESLKTNDQDKPERTVTIVKCGEIKEDKA